MCVHGTDAARCQAARSDATEHLDLVSAPAAIAKFEPAGAGAAAHPSQLLLRLYYLIYACVMHTVLNLVLNLVAPARAPPHAAPERHASGRRAYCVIVQ